MYTDQINQQNPSPANNGMQDNLLTTIGNFFTGTQTAVAQTNQNVAAAVATTQDIKNSLSATLKVAKPVLIILVVELSLLWGTQIYKNYKDINHR